MAARQRLEVLIIDSLELRAIEDIADCGLSLYWYDMTRLRALKVVQVLWGYEFYDQTLARFIGTG